MSIVRDDLPKTTKPPFNQFEAIPNGGRFKKVSPKDSSTWDTFYCLKVHIQSIFLYCNKKPGYMNISQNFPTESKCHH